MPQVIVEAHEHVMVTLGGSRLSDLLHRATDVLLALFVFLFPFVYFPGLHDTLELPKQAILLTTLALAGILWIIRVFMTRTLTIRRSFIFFALVLYLVTIGIATLTSLDRYVSFFGGVFNEYASLATLVGFALLFFFVVNAERDLALVRELLIAFLSSATLLGVIMVLRFFGVGLPGLPALGSWTPVGSVFALGLVSAGTLLLAQGLLLVHPAGHREFLPGRSGTALRLLAVLAGVFHLVILIMLDWWVAWVAVLVGTGLLLLFVFVYAHVFRNLLHLLLPLITFVVAVLLLFVRTPIRANVTSEISPGHGMSWEITTATLRDHAALGSGPATYAFDFAKYRPASLLASPLWNVRFDHSRSFVLTLLPTVGLAGAIVWLLLIGLVVGGVVKSFFREREATAWLLTVVTFFPWVGLLVARFLYSSNMTLEFMFWFLTALLAVMTTRSLSPTTFVASPRALLGTSFGAVLFAVLVVTVLVSSVARTGGWFAFARSLRANAAGDFDRVREELVRAVDRDPRTDVFSRNLARVHLVEATRTTTLPELQGTLNAAVLAARRAVSAGPENSANWIVLGAIHRELAPAVTGAGELALVAFLRARELEPRNPAYPTEMGRVEIILADRARIEAESRDEAVRRSALARVAEHLVNAERLFNEAIELKQDFAPAHFYIAAVLDRQGRLAEAITKLESVVQFNPRDVGVAFQLGLLYLKNNNLAEAEAEFVRALELAPNYANARWYLASIYERRGDFDKAVREIEAVLATNPDSQLVQERLASLRRGQPATELPQPVIEEESELRQ
ncbi:tetratricopeptide repeat protein [Candidatus Uhrbacteria bacterium]|nr:tetratricopeptide repeat protein [Candidatus Uhrbacteria bacterium]